VVAGGETLARRLIGEVGKKVCLLVSQHLFDDQRNGVEPFQELQSLTGYSAHRLTKLSAVAQPSHLHPHR
jgi:hypothetical protein